MYIYLQHTITVEVKNYNMFFSRKDLYQDVFEYDYPLVHPESRVFRFTPIHENEYENPWKESFKQLVSMVAEL